MMKMRGRKSERALTLVELLIVIAIIALIAAWLLPANGGKNRALRTQCVNNLRQVALGFHQWADDHGGLFPMAVSTNSGGTTEFAGGKDTYRHFLALAGSLPSPRVLFCPADDRPYATVFTNAPPNHISFADRGNRSLSYFVGLDATRAHLTGFLSGDHNLTNTTLQSAGILELRSDDFVSWTETNLKSGHKIKNVLQGNVMLSDGGVQSWNTKQLQVGLDHTGIATSRLAMPVDGSK